MTSSPPIPTPPQSTITCSAAHTRICISFRQWDIPLCPPPVATHTAAYIHFCLQRTETTNTFCPDGVEKRGIYDRLESLNPNFLSRIQVAGAKHDIAFSIRGVTGNTRTAHRLIAVALRELGPAGQSGVVEQLYQGHFEDGRDLGDDAWLVTVGVAAGIPEAVVRSGLEDEEAGRRLDAVAQAARDVMGVEAVPCVMVQDRYKVGGYQEAHVFESLFEKIRLAGEGL